MFGREEAVAEGGFHHQACSEHEAKYLIYAQATGREVARLPTQPVELSRFVSASKKTPVSSIHLRRVSGLSGRRKKRGRASPGEMPGWSLPLWRGRKLQPNR
jgi:hypothetical protein